MTNIVVLCHERYRLTVQCIDSIRKNTDPESYNLTLVDDGSQDFRVRNYLRDQAIYHPKNTTLLEVTNSRHCLGALKNLGIRHSESTFGRGEWLCVLDNDMCVFPDWLDNLFNSMDPRIAILGGVRHPFHQTERKIGTVDVVDAVAGYCHFMSWGVYDELRKSFTRREYTDLYVTDAPGIGQSEDFELCQRAEARGANVGYVSPPVMAHCGITNSNGEPIAGAELIERVPGVLYL